MAPRPPNGEAATGGTPDRRRAAPWLAVGLLAALAFALATYRAEAKSIWWDESLSLHRARRSAGEILSNRIDLPGSTTVDLHPPLYFLLLRGAIGLLGERDLALRFPSAVFATLTVPCLYALGARLRSRRAGACAAALGAASPFVLWYAQEARMYTMATFLGVASLYALWRAVEGRRASWGVAYALLTLLGLGTHYLHAALLGAQLCLIPFLWPLARSGERVAPRVRGVGGRAPALLGALAAVVAVGGLVALGAVRLFVERDAGRAYVPLGEMLADTLHVFGLGATAGRSVTWPLDLAFLGVFVVGLATLWAEPGGRGGALARWRGPVALVAPIAVPLVGMWAYSRLVGPLYMGSRYMIMGVPAFYVGVGIGVDRLWRARRAFGPATLCVLLASMAVSDWRYYFHPAYGAKEDHRAAAEWVAREGRPGDAVVITAPENVVAFDHYYDGGLPVYPVPSVALTGGSDAGRIEGDLAAVLAGPYDRIWLVHSRTMFSDPEDRVLRWLDEHLLLLARSGYPSTGSPVTVSVYLARPPVLDGAPGGAAVGRFGDALELRSWRVRYGTAGGGVGEGLGATEERALAEGAAARPGRSISVGLDWSALGPLGSYKVSLRLLDAGGHVWTQSDDAPYLYFPMEDWPAGATVRHAHGLHLPYGLPPGAYLLRLVVYEAGSGEPLPFTPEGEGAAGPDLDLGYLLVGRTVARHGVRWALPDYLRPRELPAVWGELELWAWEVAPQVVRDDLYLNLYWRARRTPSDDYALLVNWRDEAGRVWHSSVHPPAGVPYATSGWGEGQVVRGSFRVALPPDAPSGRHTVHLLVHAPGRGAFLWLRRGPLPWPGRDLQVAQVEIP